MSSRTFFRLAVSVALIIVPATSQAQQIRFSITCDNRSYAGFADVLGQIDSVAGGPGEFMVSPGDVDPPAGTRSHLDAAFGASFPWYPSVGNHEEETAAHMTYLRNYYTTHLAGTVNPGPTGSVETTYSFDAGDVHIACINEYWNGGAAPGSDVATNGDVVEPLRNWLANDLDGTTKKWKLVVGHEPAYPQPDEDWGDAKHVGDSLDAHPGNRDAFWSLLEEKGVTAYICGHTHRFSHYQPPGSEVWQIDSAQARGTGIYDTFLIVTADAQSIQFDAYRSLVGGQFALTDTWVVPEPAGLSLLSAVALMLLRRRTT